MQFEKAEKFRVKSGPWASKIGDVFGMFLVRHNDLGNRMTVMVAPSDSEWQHVSVSYPYRTPTWNEMCFIKNLFWGEDATVVQFHPKKSEYVNNHPHCLHLWRHKSGHELPPSI